ncbi:MAG: sigma 54-interacting transcriptional regulator [Syntrophomonadaceae bacterium]|jgi:PAS domain S-box-containing protein
MEMIEENIWSTENPWISVRDMMNRNYQAVRVGDSWRKVIEAYKVSKLDTIPVVNDDEILIGVIPRNRLYKALLDGSELDDPCTPYIITSPVYVLADLSYNQISMVFRVNRSRVGCVPVVDKSGRLVGMLGKLEYLRTSLKLTAKTSALFKSVFHAMHDAIITVDQHGYIRMVNHSAETMFGIDAQEVKGIHLEDILPEISYDTELRLGVKLTVRAVPVFLNQVPIMENNNLVGVNYIFADLSRVEEITQELEVVKELQTTLCGVLSAASDGVFVTDNNGMVKYVNDLASELVETPLPDITGKPLSCFLPGDLPAQVLGNGLSEADVCHIKGRNCIVSHVPIIKNNNGGKPVGVVSTVYLADNKIADQIARKWLSLRQQVQYYRDELEKKGAGENTFDNILTYNPEFIKLKKEAQRVARRGSTVLITGESGVGKDIFARAIHAASPRAKRPFVKVNCAAIPETLLESELFGYAPGSFTGASKKGKPGYFEQADEGTIFLDEIGDTPLSIQVKILQVLQEKQFMRVGGVNTQKVDVRIIAATNRDLREAISNGEFREDLFYRLNVIEFRLPPLRVRPEDTIPLAELFIEKYNSILKTKVTGISQQCREVLQTYSWPGNIRELENAVERACNYACEGEIGLEHLPPQILQGDKNTKDQVSYITNEQISYRTLLNDVNKEIILEALKKSKGNKSAAARMLKISRSAFYEKLARFGIT